MPEITQSTDLTLEAAVVLLRQAGFTVLPQAVRWYVAAPYWSRGADLMPDGALLPGSTIHLLARVVRARGTTPDVWHDPLRWN